MFARRNAGYFLQKKTALKKAARSSTAAHAV